MNESWIKTTLGECAIINDRKYRPNEQWSFVNYLETGQITDNRISGIHHFDASKDKIPASARRKVRPGDIVYSTVRPNKNHFGRIKNVPDNFLVSTAFAVIRGKPCIADTSYIYYYIIQKNIIEYFHTLAEHSSSAYPSLQMRDLEELQILLPPIEQQQSVALLLERFDDKIHINQQMNEALEEIANTLFKSWFVDFDPVRAKIDGNWQPGQSLLGLPAHLYDLFPDRFITSELGEIPEGWEVSSLDQIADFINGLALQRFPADDNNYLPVIKIAEMRRGYTASTAKASPDIDSKYIVNDGDLLFSWSGSLEVVLWAHGTGALNQHLFKVTSDIYPKWFYYGWITEYLDEFRQIAAGKATTMGHIQRHHLKDSKIAIPSYDLFELGDKILGPVLDKYVLSSVENRGLTEMRDALLPKLLSGKIRVEDLEGVLG